MKKLFTILFSTFLVTNLAFSQYRLKPEKLKKEEMQEQTIPGEEKLQVKFEGMSPVQSRRATNTYGTEVGASTYDYQTNGTMQRRLVVDPNGNITVTWTHGYLAGAPAFPNRRAGYNYYDASAGTWAGLDTVGGNRRGWPTLAGSQGGEDIIFSHTPQRMHFRSTAGTGGWTHTDLAGAGITGTTFANSAAHGDTIHHISGATLADGTEGFLYSRSPDNGTTWDLTDIALPGMDSTNFLNDFGPGINAGDGFTMDARGNTVAIVTGGWKQPTHLFKSTDRGETWSYNQIFQFDTTCADRQSDGSHIHFGIDDSYSIAIDENGKIHISGGLIAFNSDPGTIGGGTSFFPYVQGLVYWNEDQGYDLCLNDTLVNDQYILLEFIDEDGDGINSTPNSFDSIARYYNHAIITYTGLATADDGTVVLTWSGVREDMVNIGIYLNASSHDGLSRVNRDLYAWASLDGGATWEIDSVRNIADDIANAGGGLGTPVEEDVFSYTYPRISGDSLVHMIFQTDDQGGGFVRDGGTASDSYIVQYSFPYWKVTGQKPISGLAENVANNTSMKIAPNPSKDVIDLMLDLKVAANYSLEISNLVGRSVYAEDLLLEKGLNSKRIDLNSLDPGVYLISVKSNDTAITQKLIVE